MTYETPQVLELGNAEELTLGDCGCHCDCCCAGAHHHPKDPVIVEA